MRRRIVTVLMAVFAAAVLSGCGTGTFDAHYEVGVAADAAATPVPVSMFDPMMGNTQDWAERTLGTASPGQPYEATITAVESRMLTDTGPSPELSAGLYLPSRNTDGWYVVAFTPQDGVEQEVSAKFVPWDAPGPTGSRVPLRIRATADGSAWNVSIVLPASATTASQ